MQIGRVNQYFAIVGPRNRNLSGIDRTQDRGFVPADRSSGCCKIVHRFQLPLQLQNILCSPSLKNSIRGQCGADGRGIFVDRLERFKACRARITAA